jgi:hypothetical protein
MSLPAGIQTVTLYGTYPHPDGTPMRGTVSVTPRPGKIVAASSGVTVQGPVVRDLDATGSFTMTVVATDSDGINPTGFTYDVTLSFVDAPGDAFPISLPKAAPTVSLNAITPAASPSSGTYLIVTGPAGPAGPTGAPGPQPALGAAGAGSTIALKSDDPSTSDARTPTAHAASHAAGNSDPLTPAAIGAETPAGATSKIATHASATDPHNDRSWASGQFYPLTSGSNLDTYVNDLLNRIAAVEGGTAFLAGLNVTGLSRIINTVLQIEGASGAVRHTLDGGNNKLGFHGATAVTRQTVSGSRADGTAAASLLSALATLGLVTDSSTAGPAGPGWADRPTDQNLLAWTYDPNMAGHVTAQSNAGVAGRITLVRIILREAITWSNVWIGLAGIDAAAVLSNCYLGVYDSGGTLKGATADISSSLMTGATAKALPLTASFSAAAGTYFIAMLLNGTWATNSLTFKGSGAGISVNAGLSAPNLRYSNMLTAQTSLPSSLTLASQTTTIINTGWGSQWYGVS